MHVLLILLMTIAFNGAHAAGNDTALSGSLWTTKCVSNSEATANDCAIERSIYVGSQRKIRVLTINVEVADGGEEAILRFLVPLKTLLPLGIKLEIPDQKTFKGSFVYCESKGCYSQIELDRKSFLSFIASESVVVSYNLLEASNNAVQLKVDLSDFKIALNELQAER